MFSINLVFEDEAPTNPVEIQVSGPAFFWGSPRVDDPFFPGSGSSLGLALANAGWPEAAVEEVEAGFEEVKEFVNALNQGHGELSEYPEEYGCAGEVLILPDGGVMLSEVEI